MGRNPETSSAMRLSKRGATAAFASESAFIGVHLRLSFCLIKVKLGGPALLALTRGWPPAKAETTNKGVPALAAHAPKRPRARTPAPGASCVRAQGR